MSSVAGCNCDRVGKTIYYADQNQGWTIAKVISAEKHNLTLELELKTEPPQIVRCTELCNHPERISKI